MSNFLQCDEEDCDHVETVEALTSGLVGKLCPKCGANLLTAEQSQIERGR